ncbi:nucleotidyl transferase AbiEii/AbiGii toxin family protein [Actinokineospora iranica]|uniref:Nucleotidyl transferase AbiEii toxin, Type IV TA system n=1 Tax=Actinokineospora iranica TaxID=1271860 RepID=A0A1G6P1G9_9PSEU|nr:nucleotidyl transferase AbiEii/AbiGii toxin family protein [Actinokineospora iranica]SDC73828.1 Nucleotidyl transferase AbiEii toxin, Type IV TA system [Actinokineospora iranica]
MDLPAAARRRLNNLARNHARATGQNSTTLVERYLYDRLLARLATHDAEGWLVKGGQALLRRYPHARHTRDLDLLHLTSLSADLDDAVAVLRTAVALDLGDHLHYVYRDTTTASKGGQARRVRFTPYYGRTALNTISVDLVVGHTPLGQPTTRSLQSCVPGLDDGQWPDVHLYPIVDHIADKISAMYERHGPQAIPSSRSHDLVDLLLIILSETIDGTTMHTALHAEVARRRQRGTMLILPAKFHVPGGQSWSAGYARDARGVTGLARHQTLNEAAGLAAAFITPLLTATPPGRWTPDHLRWLNPP